VGARYALVLANEGIITTGTYKLVHPPGVDEVEFSRHERTQGGILAVPLGTGALLVLLPLEDAAFTASAATMMRAKRFRFPIILYGGGMQLVEGSDKECSVCWQ
jgi:hypothetical protein